MGLSWQLSAGILASFRFGAFMMGQGKPEAPPPWPTASLVEMEHKDTIYLSDRTNRGVNYNVTMQEINVLFSAF